MNNGFVVEKEIANTLGVPTNPKNNHKFPDVLLPVNKGIIGNGLEVKQGRSAYAQIQLKNPQIIGGFFKIDLSGGPYICAVVEQHGIIQQFKSHVNDGINPKTKKIWTSAKIGPYEYSPLAHAIAVCGEFLHKNNSSQMKESIATHIAIHKSSPYIYIDGKGLMLTLENYDPLGLRNNFNIPIFSRELILDEHNIIFRGRAKYHSRTTPKSATIQISINTSNFPTSTLELYEEKQNKMLTRYLKRLKTNY
jgi:hypothetical protein